MECGYAQKGMDGDGLWGRHSLAPAYCLISACLVKMMWNRVKFTSTTVGQNGEEEEDWEILCPNDARETRRARRDCIHLGVVDIHVHTAKLGGQDPDRR